MSTLRKHHKDNYTTIQNDVFDDDNGLSFCARGILSFLLSKPDNWEIRIPHLVKVGLETENKIKESLKELAVTGFLMRKRERTPDGKKIKTVTHIADYPRFINVGTPKSRIYGYDPDDPNPPNSKGSEPKGSEPKGSEPKGSLVSTELVSTEELKKEQQQAATTPMTFDNPEPSPSSKVAQKTSEFVKAYYEIWGMMVRSLHEGQQIGYWEDKVTIEGWRYALKESAGHGARNWKYLEKILERVEREGVPTKEAAPPLSNEASGIVDFSFDDLRY